RRSLRRLSLPRRLPRAAAHGTRLQLPHAAGRRAPAGARDRDVRAGRPTPGEPGTDLRSLRRPIQMITEKQTSPRRPGMNAQRGRLKGAGVVLASPPGAGGPRRGEALLLTGRGGDGSTGVVVQVVEHPSASYPGDTESSTPELLEQSIADRLDIVTG